jgi:hypothetical protein
MPLYSLLATVVLLLASQFSLARRRTPRVLRFEDVFTPSKLYSALLV